jgi:hypothetical protein
MIVQRQSPPLEFLPVQVLIAFTLLYHGDAIFYGANQLAQIAAHAFLFLDGIGIVRLSVSQVDRLVRSVLAGDIAQAAMNALVLVDIGNDMKIDIKVFPVGKRIHRLTDEIGCFGKPFLIHPVA